MPDAVEQDPQHNEAPDAAQPSADAAEQIEPEGASERREPSEAPEREPVVEEIRQQVTLQRSVRYGRVIVGAGALGAIVGMLLSTVFPVVDEAMYTMGQIVGFMAIIGGAVGLTVGGALAIILTAVARRRSGSGIAIQTDVR